MAQIRVCDYIAQFIEERGVKDVFLLSGGGIMHLTDGLACNNNINVICCQHEQAASMAMDAYARITKSVSVGFFTTGPGATNAITGCAGAWLDSVPCLFISGQAKRKEAVYNHKIQGLRQIGVQEINILPMVKSITKYSTMINEPNEIQFQLEKAWHMATEGRPGPVWIDIPLDVQGAYIDTDKLKEHFVIKSPKKMIADNVLSAIEYLGEAERPVILAGHGVRISDAAHELLTLASQLNIPIVTTYLGIDIIDSKSPHYVGRVGIKGDRTGNIAIQRSDLLIVLGSSLPIAEIGYEYDKFAPKAKKIVVDIDTTSHKKSTINIDLLIESDLKPFLETLTRVAKNFVSDRFVPWHNELLVLRDKYPVCLPEYAKLEDKVNIYYFIDTLSKQSTPNDIIITDAGSAFYAGSQAVQIKEGMRYITSGGLATMGFSLPASIGASIAAGGSRVMCITGDGSFQQNIQELQTVVHYKLPIKIFVLNNEGYLSIRFTQCRYFEGRLIGEGCNSGVTFPETAKIAEAYGIKYRKIKNNDELFDTLNEIMPLDEPVICEIITPPDQEIIPTVASRKNEDGTMVSEPLDNMYPFLPEFSNNEEAKLVIDQIKDQIEDETPQIDVEIPQIDVEPLVQDR
jgi:acetolactate synthase I/II/III large subunit